jgi:hypothetical protein
MSPIDNLISPPCVRETMPQTATPEARTETAVPEEFLKGACPHLTLGFHAVHRAGSQCQRDSIPRGAA